MRSLRGADAYRWLKYFAVLLCATAAMLSGMGPSTRCIIARCSRFSCVWNSACPAIKRPAHIGLDHLLRQLCNSLPLRSDFRCITKYFD